MKMWIVYNNNNDDEGQRTNFDQKFLKLAWASGSGELHVNMLVSLGQHSLTCTSVLPHFNESEINNSFDYL